MEKYKMVNESSKTSIETRTLNHQLADETPLRRIRNGLDN